MASPNSATASDQLAAACAQFATDNEMLWQRTQQLKEDRDIG
jgi:hypothetical protein